MNLIKKLIKDYRFSCFLSDFYFLRIFFINQVSYQFKVKNQEVTINLNDLETYYI